MKTLKIIWDDGNLNHFAERRNRCSIEDVEDILLSRAYPSHRIDRPVEPWQDPKCMVHGRTRHGVYLVIMANVLPGHVFRPFTCWPMDQEDTRVYRAWCESVKNSHNRRGLRNNPASRTAPRGKPQWPVGGISPIFRSVEEETRFWQRWSFADEMEQTGVELGYEPSKKKSPRKRTR